MNILNLLDEFNNYSSYLRGVSPQTIKRYQENICYFCSYTEISKVEEITKKKVLSFFMYGRSERHWKPRTYRTYYMSLKVFFRWLNQEGYLRETFIEELMLPSIGRSLPKALKKTQAQKLLTDTYNYPWQSEFERIRNYAIVTTYIFTGVRKNELLALREEDIQFENSIIRVNKGKGSKDRVIPMNNMLIDILKNCIAEKRKRNYLSPFLFCSSLQDNRLKEHGLKHLINRLRKITGLKLSNHLLRHTFAVLMLQGGCDIVSLSKMLGHSDIRTTMIYLEVSNDQLKTQMGKHPLGDVANEEYSGVIKPYEHDIPLDYARERSQSYQILR